MNDKDFIAELRRLKINTKSIACLGCAYENGCTTKGCRLIGMAADAIEKYESAIESIEKMYYNANGAGKSYLRDVLKIFHIYMPPIPAPRANIAQKQSNVNLSISCDTIANATPLFQTRKRVTDFERCADASELADTLRCIDESGYEMSGVTQDASGVYTVFFRRPARE